MHSMGFEKAGMGLHNDKVHVHYVLLDSCILNYDQSLIQSLCMY